MTCQSRRRDDSRLYGAASEALDVVLAVVLIVAVILGFLWLRGMRSKIAQRRSDLAHLFDQPSTSPDLPQA